MKIAIDIMGTDHGPKELVLGAVNAVKKYDCEVVLVGDEEVAKEWLGKYNALDNQRIKIQHASQVINMDEHPAIAVKSKKDASIVVASKMLRAGECDALVSAGSTGAASVAAVLCVGRIKGVERPAIATPFPNQNGTTVVLDSGSMVDAKPINLVHSAIMGSVYAEKLLNLKNPKVGLLSVGEEETKGNEQTLATYPLLKETKQINFKGNVEGRDITNGSVDVVVCDGFVGNVVLKVTEGTATLLFKMIKSTFKSDFLGMIIGMLAKPFLRRIYGRINYEEFGGCLLLGVKGITVISHGRSSSYAIKNAVRVAKNAVESGVNTTISEIIA